MKKGFTLIELLTVLIILSIISLISIPIVTNIIEKGRVNAIENSVEFYVTEIESAYAEWSIQGVPSNLNVIHMNGQDIFDVKELNSILKIKGMKPVSGTISINGNYTKENTLYGVVESAKLSYEGNYDVTYTYDIHSDSKKNITIIKK